MSAPISGTAGSVVVGGTAGTAVSYVTEWNLTAERNMTDVIKFGDTWADNIVSIGRVSGNIIASDDDSASQDVLIDALVNGTSVELHLYKGTAYWHGTASINSIDDAITADGKADISFAFASKNAWEHS